MASRRKKKVVRPRQRKKTAENLKKDKDKVEEIDVPSKMRYVVYGSLLIILTVFNFYAIANNNIFLIILTFFGMLYVMNRLVYVYVLRKRLSGDVSPEQKSRY
ncbi:MAG: hypothetical protein ACTSYA_08680 [Candidatus Kariarchaeaceae archaeon]